MRKIDRVLREILHRYYEKGERFFNQKSLSQTCELSLGTINPLIGRLEGFGAIERKPLGFRLIDPKRALLYWAVTRDFTSDVTYSTFVPSSATEIAAALPRGSLLTAHCGFQARLGSTQFDYHQVFAYADADEVKRVFKPTQRERRNLFVLEPDKHMRSLIKGRAAPIVQIYVDLWQLGTPGNRFVEELDRIFASAPNMALRDLVKARNGLKNNGVI